jgi:mannose-1-phosphate guanylyltransferase
VSEHNSPSRAPIKAVILCGGLGTRLRPYTLFAPKPMLPVGPKPIVEHIVDWLKANEVMHVVMATGYLGRVIEHYFGDGSAFGVAIEYARSDRPMGHAGQLKSAEGLLPRTFVCLYGDAILSFDLKRLLEFHKRKNALVTMALMRYETRMKYGVISTKSDGRVSKWKEKPAIGNDINVGCYVMEKKFLGYIPRGRVYGMKEAFKSAMEDDKGVYALRVEGEFTDIGDIRAHKAADEAYIKRYGKIP